MWWFWLSHTWSFSLNASIISWASIFSLLIDIMDKNSIAYQMELTLFMVVFLFWVTVCADDSKIISDRYAVYWNSTNPR